MSSSPESPTRFTPARIFAGLLYLFVIIFIGYAAASRGHSYYYADQAKKSLSTEQIIAALRYESSNPEVYKVGAYLGLRSENYSLAAEMLDQAVAYRKNDYLLWLRLGFARYKMGDFERADYAYRRAIDLAPHYAPPKRYYGRLLLENGEIETAFQYLKQAAEISPEQRRETFHLARRQFENDAGRIERSIASESPEMRKHLIYYFIKHSLMTENTKRFLTGEQLSESEKNEFIKALIEKDNYILAREIWASQNNNKLLLSGLPSGELMLDGGFERIAETGFTEFGWQISQLAADTSIAVDESVKESGKRSLQIVMNGKTEINTKILSQIVLLEPGQSYVLSFSALVPEITSGGGIGVAAFEASGDRRLGESPVISSSYNKWNRYQFSFDAPESGAAVIGLQRLPCRTNPCPMFADLRLDNFSLKVKHR